MQTAKNGDTVLIEFVARTNDGRVVGHTQQDGPQTVTIGNAQVFPQIDSALIGMAVGAEQTVTVAAADAFGPRREELVIEIPRANLPPETVPQAGMGLSARQPDGSTLDLLVTKVTEESVTADGNHPLAGEDLHFGVTIIEIQLAA